MTTTLVLAEEISREIEAAAKEPLETAGVLLANIVRTEDDDIRILGRRLVWVPGDAYLSRRADGLAIASHGYIAALGLAEELQATAIWFHTHPGTQGVPIPSCHDNNVDREIADLFRLRTGSPFYGTLIASCRDGLPAFTGTLQREGEMPIPIDRLWEVGDRWRSTRSFQANAADPLPMFDRNVRAFGPSIQRTLGDLEISIVGCGGTGSCVAEQLVRLGVRHLTLVDGDEISASNVTRVYGSTLSDVGKKKTSVLQEHLQRIAPDLKCEIVDAMITLKSAARKLIKSDLIFGCTDDNAGRLVLCRLSSYLLTPVIDVGVLISSGDGGVLSGIDARVTTMTPGTACLVCRHRIDLRRAAAEALRPDERIRLEREGYAPALGAVEPAVVPFTTGVAAAAINELLERLVGYGPSPRPSEVLLRWHEREVSTNFAVPNPGHYCDLTSGKAGIGDQEPFLGQVWPDP